MTPEEIKYYSNPDNWLNYVFSNYNTKIVCRKECHDGIDIDMYYIQFLDGIQPMKTIRYYEKDGKMLALGITGDIGGEVTDEKLLLKFKSCEKYK